MEIGSAKTLERATVVLGSLLAESDEVAETFFLLGYCMMLQVDGDAAKEYLERSLSMLESFQKSLSEELEAIQSFDDGGLGEELEGVEERIERVRGLLEEIAEGGVGGIGGGGGGAGGGDDVKAMETA